MRVLVIGGTRFVGRHLAETAIARGHDVTLFHRGQSGEDALPKATHLHGDRNTDLDALADGSWDVTIDVCGYVPRQVRELGDALGGAGGRGGRYVFISSVSAYAEADGPGITESAPLAVLDDQDVEEITGETYGGLKALCEYAAVEAFGTATLLVRPTYVIGPYDPTGRFTYWVRRLARGGRVLVAGPAEQPVQTIDGRDLADLVVRMIEEEARGPVHVASPSGGAGQAVFTLADLLAEVQAAVAPAGTELVWLDGDAARAAGLDGRDLPLWHEGAMDWMGAVDASVALRHGLSARPVGDSARDVVHDESTPDVDGVGLSAEREAELLASSSGAAAARIRAFGAGGRTSLAVVIRWVLSSLWRPEPAHPGK